MLSIVKYLSENENIIDRAKNAVNKFASTAAEDLTKGTLGKLTYEKLHPEENDYWAMPNRRFRYFNNLAKQRLANNDKR